MIQSPQLQPSNSPFPVEEFLKELTAFIIKNEETHKRVIGCEIVIEEVTYCFNGEAMVKSSYYLGDCYSGETLE